MVFLINFESAIFSGGTIVKKGSLIYVLPKYFKPSLTAQQWLQETLGAPFVSDTGAQLEAVNAQGDIIGIDATATRIPGAEKLGIITSVTAVKDINGDGEISEEEESGWRFFEENNISKFELKINGETEVYDADQIDIDEETGTIKVYEKDHVGEEAFLLREISTRVDSLGRTLMTVKDGDGNTLLEDALITYLAGSGGAIAFDSDNNNYIFVNGQPVEVNNDFKTNGFNAITGRPVPPLLQPSSVRGDIPQIFVDEESEIPAVPIRPSDALFYTLAILVGILFIRFSTPVRRKKS